MEDDSEQKKVSMFLREIEDESDRGSTLIAASYLDESLAEMIESFLIHAPECKEIIYGFNAPLGTFSARIKCAYLLGLISKKEHNDLNIVRKIRNEFGHKWSDCTFESEKIRDLTRSLPWFGPSDMEVSATLRERFDNSSSMLVIDFMYRIEEIKKHTLKPINFELKARSISESI